VSGCKVNLDSAKAERTSLEIWHLKLIKNEICFKVELVLQIKINAALLDFGKMNQARIMKKQKLKQFGLILCCIFSLLVSSVSACTCDHGSSPAKTSEHCQPQSHSHEIKADLSHAHDKSSAPNHHDDDLAKTDAISLSLSQPECCCIKPAPKVYAKSETVKAEKQVAGIHSATRIELDLTLQIVSVKTIELIRPFYLSDSFYNVSPGRAPPRL
jgi:hypothetical protein